jgi:hypothetical protein
MSAAAGKAMLWDYAPWGLMSSTWDAKKAAQVYRDTGFAVNPEDAALMIRRMSQGATGSAFYLLFGTLIAQGLVKVLEDREREPAKAAVQELLGEEEGAIQVGGKQFRGKVFDSLGQGASVAGQVVAAMKPRAGDKDFDRLGRAVGSSINAVFNSMPVLEGASELFDDVQKLRERQPLGETAKSMGKTIVRPYLTLGPVKEAAQIADPTRRDTSADGTFAGWMKDEARGGIPGMRSQLPAQHDAFGKVKKQPDPLNVLGLKDVVKDDKAQLLKDSNVGAGMPRRKNGESSADYQQRAKSKGKQNKRAVKDFMNDKLMQKTPMELKRPLLRFEMQSDTQKRYDYLSDPARQADREKRLIVEEGVQKLEAHPAFKAMTAAKKEEALKLYRTQFNRFGARNASAKSREKMATLPSDAFVKQVIEAVVK